MADDVERNSVSLTANQPQHLKMRDSLVTRGLRNISEHLTNDIIVQAVELLRQRRTDEAISLCRSRLAEIPDDDILWQIQGVCLGEQGNNTEAIGSIERSLDLNPMNPYCWSIKSSLLAKVDRYVEAIACDDHALSLDPKNSVFKEKKQNHLMELRKKMVSQSADVWTVDIAKSAVVVTLGSWWFERKGPLVYLMFDCDIENTGDDPLHIGKEIAIYRRTKATGELSYLCDAVFLPFSPILELTPRSADTVQLEMEFACSENDSPDDWLYKTLSDSHDLVGFDHDAKVAILRHQI